jgi:hypothetical protein
LLVGWWLKEKAALWAAFLFDLRVIILNRGMNTEFTKTTEFTESTSIRPVVSVLLRALRVHPSQKKAAPEDGFDRFIIII